MPNRSVLETRFAQYLRCPATGFPLRREEDRLVADGGGKRSYPIVEGVPVLLDYERSVFAAEAIVANRYTGVYRFTPLKESSTHRSAAENLIAKFPSLSRNWRASENVAFLKRVLRQRESRPRVLILGCGELGAGMSSLVDSPDYDVVETDVYIGTRTMLVSDAHDIPFADATFDAVVVQGILSVVIHPDRVVQEIHRVLKEKGLVYAEAPFVQQVCTPYDFRRFTHLGLLFLFRKFNELRSGAQGGPGMTMAWSYSYLLRAFAGSSRGRSLAGVFARLTGFWLVSLDRWILDRPASLDAASGVYFLGERSDKEMSDAEVLQRYRGAF